MLNEVPLAQGLLTFRKDTNRLYLRSGSTWRTVADETMVSRIFLERDADKIAAKRTVCGILSFSKMLNCHTVRKMVVRKISSSQNICRQIVFR